FERGFIVYERQAGTDYDLYVYDASRTATVALGDDRAVVERYVAKVGSDRLLFSKESASARTLHLYDVRTGETTLVAAADGESAGDALVGATGLVYYELSSQGQNDVYVFDPTTGTSSPVSTDGNAGEVVATLADGALWVSRLTAPRRGWHDRPLLMAARRRAVRDRRRRAGDRRQEQGVRRQHEGQSGRVHRQRRRAARPLRVEPADRRDHRGGHRYRQRVVRRRPADRALPLLRAHRRHRPRPAAVRRRRARVASLPGEHRARHGGRHAERRAGRRAEGRGDRHAPLPRELREPDGE